MEPGDEGVLYIGLPAKARVHSPAQPRLPIGTTQDNYMMLFILWCCHCGFSAAMTLTYIILLLYFYYECSLSS